MQRVKESSLPEPSSFGGAQDPQGATQENCTGLQLQFRNILSPARTPILPGDALKHVPELRTG